MSSLPSLQNGSETVSSRFWLDREAERKSGNYAAMLTVALMLAVSIALLWPRSVTLAVPLGDMPLRVEIRRLLPPEPEAVTPEPPKPEVRKLLHEIPEPDRLTVPEPQPPVVEEVKFEPPKEVEPPKSVAKPIKKPVKPQPKTLPAPVVTNTTSTAPAESTLPAGPVGHASGQLNVKASNNGAIITALLHAVEARKEYPRQARLAGVEGKIVLRVVIGANGRITACTLAESSGKKLLDAAAEKLGAALVGLDIPAARGADMTVRVPVSYTLKR